MHDIAMRIAAAKPEYVSRTDVPDNEIEREKAVLQPSPGRGKPEKIIEKMVEGRIEKYYKENCLLEQAFIKDPDITVEQHT